jgi:hypothetical protein
MLVKTLASANYFSHTSPVNRKDNRATGSAVKKTSFGHNDSYIPSKSIKELEDVKAKNLTEVKKRIDAGFYNSSAVNDDLTEVFSNIFKKTFT